MCLSVQDYAGDPLIFDDRYRQKLLTKLAHVALAVAAAFDGRPQDVEGVVGADGETVHVTQTRPQVLRRSSAAAYN